MYIGHYLIKKSLKMGKSTPYTLTNHNLCYKNILVEEFADNISII